MNFCLNASQKFVQFEIIFYLMNSLCYRYKLGRKYTNDYYREVPVDSWSYLDNNFCDDTDKG